ncbi:MAG: NUDIX hydrolase, partial [Muribaculaceae bacterium]|nr:NUDIX hydrolase [Muribaculaceae bacterium]
LLTVIAQNPSTCNNYTHCFLATNVEKVDSQHLDSTEDISVRLLSEDEVWHMLMADEMKQALMAAPLWKYFALKSRR